eukprot:scaffold34669_cov139-Skeletonema_dohrnii-CCMP3373.AAC.1
MVRSEGCTNQVRQGGVCIRHGARRKLKKNAAGKDVLIKLKKEECVLGMGHRRRDAAVKDAQIMLSREEYVGGSGEERKGGVCITPLCTSFAAA